MIATLDSSLAPPPLLSLLKSEWAEIPLFHTLFLHSTYHTLGKFVTISKARYYYYPCRINNRNVSERLSHCPQIIQLVGREGEIMHKEGALVCYLNMANKVVSSALVLLGKRSNVNHKLFGPEFLHLLNRTSMFMSTCLPIRLPLSV